MIKIINKINGLEIYRRPNVIVILINYLTRVVYKLPNKDKYETMKNFCMSNGIIHWGGKCHKCYYGDCFGVKSCAGFLIPLKEMIRLFCASIKYYFIEKNK